MKSAVFSRAAPAPLKVLKPMHAVPGGARTEQGPTGACRVTPYAREFQVKRDGSLVSLRYELHVRQDDDTNGAGPKICKIVLSMLS